MNAERAQFIKQLFSEASELRGEARDRFLNERCAGDLSLRAAIDRLLSADAAGQSQFLAGQSHEFQETSLPVRIGHFRVLRRIAVGGMGSVFEAEQDQPRRRVALKVIRMTMASESIRRRFEHEVEILGQLKHPGIAQIYEAGTYDDGTGPAPYFAMEFIDGKPLMDFVKESDPTIRQRLALMAAICDAVHHAHQHGVVHRDLKPANILVEGSASGVHQPKVLDFGVARAIRSDEKLTTMHTEAGQLVGTLSYMSPEQVAGSPNDLDIRSDIYTLGVILFEMLSSRLPYDLRDRSIIEAGGVIREQDATRLSSIDNAFRGDIETIVAKALAKEKDRRYQSTAEFGADIRRFLTDEPIVARPASRAYQLHKFAKRNRGLVGGVAAAFVILLFAVAVVSVALVRATSAERLAQARLEEAHRSTAKAAAVSKFLQDMLSSVDPAKTLGSEVTVRQALDDAAAKINSGSLTAQADLEAELRTAIGNTYVALGLYPEAEPHLRAALDIRKRQRANDSELVASLIDLGVLRSSQGRSAEAESLAREALDICRRPGADRLELAAAVLNVAATLREQNRYAEAEPLYEEVLAIRRELLGDNHLDVAQSLNSLGLARQNRGNYAAAEPLFRESLDIRRRLLGNEHPVVAGGINNLANLLQSRGETDEAEALLREALDMRRRIFGAEHPDVSQALNNLALLLLDHGKYADAEPLYREALANWRKVLPSGHLHIGHSATGLGLVLTKLGHLAEAETLLREALAIREASLPPGSWGRYTSRSALGAVLAEQGKYVEAEELLLDACERLKESADVPAARKQQAFERIIRLYELWNRPKLAMPWRAELARKPTKD